MSQLWVWIDQDLCTGDGLCTDHCPEVFRLLDDGISYVVGADGAVRHQPGGAAEPVAVPDRRAEAVVAAADDCPGECIFLEEHANGTTPDRPPAAPEPADDAWSGAEDPADGPEPNAPPPSWPRAFVLHWVRAVTSPTDRT